MADSNGTIPPLQTPDPEAGRKHLDAGSFAFDFIEGVAEGGIIGTVSVVVLTALSNLPIVIITAGNAPFVATAVAGLLVIVQTARSFRRNYQ